jgi:hypothetical protein
LDVETSKYEEEIGVVETELKLVEDLMVGSLVGESMGKGSVESVLVGLSVENGVVEMFADQSVRVDVEERLT